MVNGIVIIELTKTSLVLGKNYKHYAKLKKHIICIIKKQLRTFKLTRRFFPGSKSF